MKGMLAFAGAIIIVWFVFLIYSILAYIFGALGLSSMAKNAGLKMHGYQDVIYFF